MSSVQRHDFDLSKTRNSRYIQENPWSIRSKSYSKSLQTLQICDQRYDPQVPPSILQILDGLYGLQPLALHFGVVLCLSVC